MPIQRHFLGWDGPALPRAAVWLREKYTTAAACDLSRVIVVLPVARAGRRLLELLACENTDAAVLVPPRIVTVGQLPELLYTPPMPLADDLRSLLARLAALRQADRATLEQLLAHPPREDDLSSCLALVRQLRQLGDDLAAARLRVADIPTRLAASAIDFRSEERWLALAHVEQRYHDTLQASQHIDTQAARLHAIETRRCQCEGDIVLVATADLSPMLAAMLRELSSSIFALIQAPVAHAQGFDELGGFRPDYWEKQQVSAADDRIRFVDRPNDQACEILRAIAEHASRNPHACAADHISVGLGDEQLAPLIKRTLDMAGVPARYGKGRAFSQSPPALFLAAFARFMTGQRFDDFAQLLRHPDVEQYLTTVTGQATEPAVAQWLSLLDDYATEHLQGQLTGDWLGDEDHRLQLSALWQAVQKLLPPSPRMQRPLSQWSEPIAAALRSIYGKIQLQRFEPQGQQLIQALTKLAEILGEQAHFDEQSLLQPRTDMAGAITFTLSRLADQSIAEEAGEPAVELMGYLELALDDAPLLVISSMNEGHVPTVRTADALLPDSTRRALGLPDNVRRYARDLMLLEAMIQSRPHTILIAGRRSTANDPLTPSRLLLACEDQNLLRRINRFYSQEPTPLPTPALLIPGDKDRFLVPRPLFAERPLDRLPVTGFRDYLACPYRFYLKHVLRLCGVDDRGVEMDAMSFGSLAHQALEAFGRSDLTRSTQPAKIAEFLFAQLDTLAHQHYGRQPRPALRIQIEQLRQRLATFAQHQAQWTSEGWHILQGRTEKSLQITLQIDGQPFTITGRVDRVDHHRHHGYRILDYKTGDTAKTPQANHQKKKDGQLTWVDLQLPLYRCLGPQLAIDDHTPVQLGYITLPKKLTDVGLSLAPWTEDDLHDAMTVRDAVIRDIRSQKFWPPNDPPSFTDDFAGICGDEALNRRELLAACDGEEGMP
jgi:hypothetical protein